LIFGTLSLGTLFNKLKWVCASLFRHFSLFSCTFFSQNLLSPFSITLSALFSKPYLQSICPHFEHQFVFFKRGHPGNNYGVAESSYECQLCTYLKVSLSLGFKNSIKEDSYLKSATP
jgi:hypothetical protein